MSRKVLNTTTDLMSLVEKSVQGVADQSTVTSTNKENNKMARKNTVSATPANVASLSDLDMTKYMVVGKVTEQDALDASFASFEAEGTVVTVTEKKCIGFDIFGTKFMFMHSPDNGGFFSINVTPKIGAHIITDYDKDNNKLDAIINQKKINGWLSAMSGLHTGKWAWVSKGFMCTRTQDDLSIEGTMKHCAFVRNTCNVRITISDALKGLGINSPADLLDTQVGVCDYTKSNFVMVSISTDVEGYKEEPVSQTIERRQVYRSWGMDNIVRGNGMNFRPAFKEFTTMDGVTISHKISTNNFLSSYCFGFALESRESRDYVAGKYAQKIARVEMAQQYAETRKILAAGNVVPSVVVAEVMAPKTANAPAKMVQVSEAVIKAELIGKFVCQVIGTTILPETICTPELIARVNMKNAELVKKNKKPCYSLILA